MSTHITRKLTRSLSQMSGLPIDVALSSPMLQLLNDREAIVEDVKRIEYYDETSVKISACGMNIAFSGRGLEIKCLSAKNLSVVGVITDIAIERS